MICQLSRNFQRSINQQHQQQQQQQQQGQVRNFRKVLELKENLAIGFCTNDDAKLSAKYDRTVLSHGSEQSNTFHESSGILRYRLYTFSESLTN